MSNKSSTITGREGDVPRHAIKRLQSEYKQLKSDPERYIIAEPDPSNILNWHYVITGPPDTPYYNGVYHGMLKFPKEYPFQPPSILMFTPNGRFLTNKRLCLSMSDYHPERWNPAWGVGTILVGLLSFMNSNESEKSLGVMTTSDACKKRLAEESFDFNRKIDRVHGAIFNELFTIFMWEEEERREHRLKRRKLEELEESVENSKTLTENTETSENGENFSDSKNVDSSSEKSCSSDENEGFGNTSSSSSNNSPDKSKNTSYNTSNSTSNCVKISGDCGNSGEDALKKEIDAATAKALSKFDRPRQRLEREEQAKLDLRRFRKHHRGMNFETSVYHRGMMEKLKNEQEGPENRAKKDEEN
jgi:ubiquitin-conjugating enzyme E2 J2